MSRARATVAAAVALVSVLYYGAYYDYGLNPFDEGYLVSAAERTYEGQLPHRDFFHHYAPGRFYLVSALYEVFDVDLLVVRRAYVALRAAANALYFTIAATFLPLSGALAATAVVVTVPGPWYKTLFALTSFASLAATLGFLRLPSVPRALVAGLVAGGCFTIRQDVGAFALIAFLLALALSAKKNATFLRSPT